ncbi:SDR family oxidoreductase [Ramlibacter sp. AW1]|uniref:SDR family oxidoreductase n=1 Tax=Ramlibacter aurantiacus TaxID=2801330 RepID=A0A936ZHY0_9BURK|nr:SDR family oxidoreductase [Ramlibacter aurantiacus]MBL0421764.1 SDR family oxidoreductase [Ramlibacter aurantiacus]
MATVLVIGASRGIGLEFARQYAEAGDRVIATARSDEGLARLSALGARALRLDVTDPARMSSLGWELDGEKLDVALYVAGVYSTGSATEPPSRQAFDRVLHANVLGAMQAIPQVAPMVEAAEGRFGFLTSGMARIAGVSSSFGWTYRVSKAALNMAVAAAQNDYPRALMVAIDPGWVQTDMGGPSAPLPAADSVRAMRATLAALTPSQRGRFIHYDGRPYEGW